MPQKSHTFSKGKKLVLEGLKESEIYNGLWTPKGLHTVHKHLHSMYVALKSHGVRR